MRSHHQVADAGTHASDPSPYRDAEQGSNMRCSLHSMRAARGDASELHAVRTRLLVHDSIAHSNANNDTNTNADCDTHEQSNLSRDKLRVLLSRLPFYREQDAVQPTRQVPRGRHQCRYGRVHV